MCKKILIALVVMFFLFAGNVAWAVDSDDTATRARCDSAGFDYVFCINANKQCASYPSGVLQTTDGIVTAQKFCNDIKAGLLGCNTGGSSPLTCAKSLTTQSAGCCVSKDGDKIKVCEPLKNGFDYNTCSSNNLLYSAIPMIRVMSALGVVDQIYANRGGCETISGCPQFTGNPLQTTNILKDLQVREPVLNIKIPGLTFTDVQNTLDEEGNIHLPWIGELIAAIYKFGMVVASVIAVVMIIVQGARIVTSGGGDAKIAAYKRIAQIVVGLSMVWGSYFILYNINPDLVNFKVLKVKYIQPIPFEDRTFEKESEKQDYSDALISKTDLDNLFKAYAGCYGYDWRVLKAVASKESGLNPKSVTGKYKGLFQFDTEGCQDNIKTFPASLELDCKNLFDPETNTAAAAYRFNLAFGRIKSACDDIGMEETMLLLYVGHNNGPAVLKEALKKKACTKDLQKQAVRQYPIDHPAYGKKVDPDWSERKWLYGNKIVNALKSMGATEIFPSNGIDKTICPKNTDKRAFLPGK